MDAPPKLYTAVEVAAILSLAPRTIGNMVQAGRLPCVRLSKKSFRISHDDLMEWIKKRKTPCVAVRSKLSR